MKKIFLLLILISAHSCREKESKTTNEIITNKKDTVSLQKKTEVELASANTYDCDGIMSTTSAARIKINLPAETVKNKYTFKVYNVSDGKGNKLVIHLKDNAGLELSHAGNFYEYFLNFAEIIKCEGADDLDIYEPFSVVVFHESHISDGDIKKSSSTIFKLAQNHSCSDLRKKIAKYKVTEKKDLLTPKTCGLGTIKPYLND